MAARVGGREKILKMAARLFYADGIDTVSVDRIATEAGLTKRAVYYHFPDKGALVAAYLEAAQAPALTVLQTLCADAAPGEERLRLLFANLRSLLTAPGFRGCAFVRAATSQGAARGGEAARIHKKAVRAWLSEEARIAAFAKPDEVAASLQLVLDGALGQATCLDPDEIARAAIAAADAVLTGDGA